MNLMLNRVYGIVYRYPNGVRRVFNARVVSIGRTTFLIRFMNDNGVVVRLRILKSGVRRAVLI